MRPENAIGTPFYELIEVDSTNNYAMRQVQAQMAVHGTAWFAHYQNAGRGQRGKVWNALSGQNIILSIALEPTFLSIDNQFLLNLTMALAASDFFNKHTGGDTKIKWPNDIYWKDRKAGGILIENVLQGREWRFSIAGIGININQTLFPSSLPNPVSLKQVTGKSFDVILLAKELCGFLNIRWTQLKDQYYNNLLDEYTNRLYKLGEKVVFRRDKEVFEATITGVSRTGELMIDTGDLSSLPYGSVELIIS